jgi:microcompartment protein CcmL/EutN
MNQELFDAASAGDVKAVRAALDAGADIAYKDVRRWPAACVRRARGG